MKLEMTSYFKNGVCLCECAATHLNSCKHNATTASTHFSSVFFIYSVCNNL